jgi:hypothetical protein
VRCLHCGLSRLGGNPERLAPVPGGLGAGLESEDAIREAAYSYTPDADEPDADEMLAASPSESSI